MRMSSSPSSAFSIQRKAASEHRDAVEHSVIDFSALRHEAFTAKLAVHRVAAFYNELRRADLINRFPEMPATLSGYELSSLFEHYADRSRKLELALREEMIRLSVEAEWAVNAYAKARYGFSPGEDILVTLPGGERPVRFRLFKVFLQSTTESDVRLDGVQLNADSTPGVHWDLYMSGPGEIQLKKSTRKAPGVAWART